VKQVVKDSEQDDDPYVATARYVVESGSIVESDFNDGDSLTIKRYNPHHYIVSETLDADGQAPIVFAYNVDPVSNVSTGVKMSASVRQGRLRERSVPRVNPIATRRP